MSTPARSRPPVPGIAGGIAVAAGARRIGERHAARRGRRGALPVSVRALVRHLRGERGTALVLLGTERRRSAWGRNDGQPRGPDPGCAPALIRARDQKIAMTLR